MPFSRHMPAGIRNSVRRKVMLVVLATTFVALLLTGAAMMIYDLRTYHQSWVNDMVSQADLIGRASAPALAFDDERVARENLSLLKGRPKISAAAIYNARGTLFATYSRPGDPAPQFPQVPKSEGYGVEGNQLQLFKRIAGQRDQPHPGREQRGAAGDVAAGLFIARAQDDG